jgi:hypothetical protein
VKRLLALLILAWPLGAFAECADVRLDNTILKKVPMMDQDGASLCWSYTAATLIDAWRFSHGDKDTTKFTSPIALWVQGSSFRSGNGNGYTEDALNTARDMKKTCDHIEVSKKYRSTDFHLPSSSRNYKLNEKEFCLCDIPPVKTLEDADFGIRTLQKAEVEQEFKKICEGSSIPIDIPKPKTKKAKDYLSAKSFGEDFSKLFMKENPQPVAITYCADVLKHREVRTIENGVRVNCNVKHDSAVVGSRPGSSGKCEYLIRNSYGTSCNGYDWDCEVNSKGRGRGEVWISEEALLGNTEDFSWLE